ncbi:uncharacterized protein LOC131937907 [Physella acuta]|uniref:uncharacterized protein LOC131937907 n=1 Tax=Physella acuta TaxID=109671 RepID=UPI0027DAC330|nr:uncharacterized protein LOC131937907 [Physella acuta]
MDLNQETTMNTTGNSTQFVYTGATIVSPILMCLAGLVGNILALKILHRSRMESQRLMFHSLVAGLVWNDLIGIVLTTPVTLASYINDIQMPGGQHLCRFNGFIMICFGLTTPLIVSAMAIERFLFVKYTFFYTKHCAPGAARLVMLVIWGFVLFFGLLPMFGFGEYVLQYPKTWCFLNFRTSNPVTAAYGYLYSLLNLLLVLVMVVCNLVVVATLARVRDYRRKHSTGSTNSVIMADSVLEDTARQQAMAKRRKQKDIELQMIVVMCAITTIFAVCWAPLMIHIAVTLAVGNTNDVFGLVAVRLASLNQTLNPWLYVILRRALIIRVKRYCCRWRRCCRRRQTLSTVPVGRRHQYVHVRNQLCHRNNFVGGDVDESLTDSMRKSIQLAIPAAMSLPDVMMVNTGRRDLDMLPDVARAQSYGGRVSHSHSVGNVGNVKAMCHECFLERCGHQEGEMTLLSERDDIPPCPANSSAEHSQLVFGNGRIAFTQDEPSVNYLHKFYQTRPHSGPQGKPTNSRTPGLKDGAAQTKPPPGACEHSAGVVRKMSKKDFELSSSRDTSHPVYVWSRDSRLSQHMHKPRGPIKSSASVRSASGGKSGLQTSRSADGVTQGLGSPDTRRRAESSRSAHNDVEHANGFLDDSRDYDDVFDDTLDDTRRDTTTDGFSSIRTDSTCLNFSEATALTPGHGRLPLVNKLEVIHDSLECSIPNNSDHLLATDGQLNSSRAATQVATQGAATYLATNSTFDFQSPNGLDLYKNGGYEGSESSESADEDEGSSGVFSAESPVRTSRDLGARAKWLRKKESQSDVTHEERPTVKQNARRAKSNN